MFLRKSKLYTLNNLIEKPLLTRMAVKIITGMAAGKDEKKFVPSPRRMLCSNCFTYEFKMYF